MDLKFFHCNFCDNCIHESYFIKCQKCNKYEICDRCIDCYKCYCELDQVGKERYELLIKDRDTALEEIRFIFLKEEE